MNPGSVLEVRSVTVRFGGLTALDAVSLTAAPRQVTGIIGPNGAGKTTLLNVAVRVRPARRRRLRFGGRRADRAAAAPARLARHRPDPAGRRPVHRADRAGERHGRGDLPRPGRILVRAARAAAGPTATSGCCATGRGRRSTGSAPPTRPTRCPDSSPTACASGSPWPGRWWPSPPAPARRAASGLTEEELAELGELIRDCRRRMPLMVVEHHMDLMMSVCDSHRRARLRQGHRLRVAARGSGRPGGDRRLPRHDAERAAGGASRRQ